MIPFSQGKWWGEWGQGGRSWETVLLEKRHMTRGTFYVNISKIGILDRNIYLSSIVFHPFLLKHSKEEYTTAAISLYLSLRPI